LSLSVGVYTRHIAVRKFIPHRNIAEETVRASKTLVAPDL